MALTPISENQPDSTFDPDDPGAETARRFQYQYAHAAALCAALLDEANGVVELFCEQHEDVLLKLADGQFIGVQIKTRAESQPAWKASDEQVIGAFARFASLEHRFPGRFKSFQLATNHPCHHAETGKSIPYLLKLASETADFANAPGQVKTFTRKIAGHAEVTPELAFTTLKKSSLNSGLPKIADAAVRLESALRLNWPNAESLPLRALTRAATELRRACADASALLHVDALSSYLGENVESPQEREQLGIAGKRFDKGKVLTLISAAANEPVLLVSDAAEPQPHSSTSSDMLRTKLEYGGLSDVLVLNASNLRDAAEFEGAQLMRKFGPDGLNRYRHLRIVAQNEAAMAFERARDPDAAFGRKMLGEVEQRVRECARVRNDLFSFTAEHLLGLVYLLTAECKIRWSETAPWEHS